MYLIRKVLTGILLLFIIQGSDLYAQRLYPELQDICSRLSHETSSIPAPRKDSLKFIGNYILQLQKDHSPAEVLFAGKNNGCLSQVAEIWFYTALHFYKIKNIKVFSGGIVPEAINYRIVGAMKRSGFLIMPAGGYSDNPVYFMSLGRNFPDYTIFAKPIDYRSNPHSHFLVISIQSQADSADYHFYGAEKILPYHWENPGLWDDTSVEPVKYDECIHEIGRDMIFLTGYIHGQLKADKKKKHGKKKKQ